MPLAFLIVRSRDSEIILRLSSVCVRSERSPFSMCKVASSASCESVRAPGSHYHHIPRSLPLLTCILVSALPLLNTTSLADVHILQEHFKASLPNCNDRACATWDPENVRQQRERPPSPIPPYTLAHSLPHSRKGRERRSVCGAITR
jgi:hypothetical protein